MEASPEPAALVPAWLRMPQPPPRLSARNGTGTLWVTSITESISPPAPQYTLKSAARSGAAEHRLDRPQVGAGLVIGLRI